jgi:hypothetical protein
VLTAWRADSQHVGQHGHQYNHRRFAFKQPYNSQSHCCSSAVSRRKQRGPPASPAQVTKRPSRRPRMASRRTTGGQHGRHLSHPGCSSSRRGCWMRAAATQVTYVIPVYCLESSMLYYRSVARCPKSHPLLPVCRSCARAMGAWMAFTDCQQRGSIGRHLPHP